MNSAAQGDEALAKSDFPSAIQHFTQALADLPRSPSYYVKRSTANARLKSTNGGPNPNEALRDAEIGLTLARERGSRELILSSQLRRGVALFQLERYGDAGYIFGIIKDKVDGGDKAVNTAAKDKSGELIAAMANQGSGSGSWISGAGKDLSVWAMKTQMKLRGLKEGDPKTTVTVTEYPKDVHVPTEKELKNQLEVLKSGKKHEAGSAVTSEDRSKISSEGPSEDHGKGQSGTTPAASGSASASAPAPAPITKVRHEWYQSSDTVVLALYVKGVAKDSVDTDLKSDYVSTLYVTSPSFQRQI